MIKQHSLPTRIEKGSGICCSKTLWSQLVHHFCSIRCVFVVVELAATKGIPSTNQLSLPIVIIVSCQVVLDLICDVVSSTNDLFVS
jgi:hypothetical protein